jgi:tRNA1(Val) A37 N6-methylase TrmN6
MTMGFSIEMLSRDKFLGGRLTLYQPKSGYRAVLELGCGAGAGLLCLGARVQNLCLVGIERQADYADLCRVNAAENEVEADIHTADLNEMPDEVKAESFDHVIMNPPFFLRDKGTKAQDPGREGGLGEETPLADWVNAATARIKPRGYLWMVQRVERLPSIFKAMEPRLGSIVAKPLCPREGRAATLVLIAARKGGRGEFRLGAPLILHDGAEHGSDGDDYRPEACAILRDGAHLPMW